MKKKLFLGMLAAAAVTFTSCQKDEVLNSVPQDQPIEFGTYVGRGAQTKANTSIDDAADLAAKSFGVYAYYTGATSFDAATSTPNFMNNQQITSTDNGASWTYTPVKYWPNNPGEKVSFFAYAPYESDTYEAVQLQSTTTPGTPTVTYIVNTDCDKHVDLLYSNTDNTNKTKQSITGKINFNFAHALTRIGFSAQLFIDDVSEDETGSNDTDDNDGAGLGSGTQVEIKSIELIGNFDGKADLKLSDGTWSNISNTISSFTIPAEKLHNTTLTNKDKVSLNSNDNTNEDKGYLMVIPKKFDGSAGNALKIKVTYNVITTDPNLSGSDGKSEIENIIESKPFSIEFKQGKAYNFNLQLGLTSVKFSADVAAWDETDKAVNVPINFN